MVSPLGIKGADGIIVHHSNHSHHSSKNPSTQETPNNPPPQSFNPSEILQILVHPAHSPSFRRGLGGGITYRFRLPPE